MGMVILPDHSFPLTIGAIRPNTVTIKGVTFDHCTTRLCETYEVAANGLVWTIFRTAGRPQHWQAMTAPSHHRYTYIADTTPPSRLSTNRFAPRPTCLLKHVARMIRNHTDPREHPDWYRLREAAA